MPVDCPPRVRAGPLGRAALPAVVGAVLVAMGRTRLGLILVVVGGALVLLGLISPRLFTRWERLVRTVARGVGIGMTWLLLVPFFYLVFLPGRLILLLARRDPMRRASPTSLPSYWTDRPPVSPDHYTRLF